MRRAGLVVGVTVKPADHPWLSFEHFGFEDLGGRGTTGLLLMPPPLPPRLFTFVCGHDWATLRLQPRLDIPAETLDRLVTVLREELAYLCTLV